MFWCRHKWTETGRSIVPSVQIKFDQMEFPAHQAKARLHEMILAAQGHTTIILTCIKCGDITHRPIPGAIEPK